MRLYRWLKILQIGRSQEGGGGNPHLFYLQTTNYVIKRCIRLYLEYKSTDFFPEGKTGVDRFLSLNGLSNDFARKEVSCRKL